MEFVDFSNYFFFFDAFCVHCTPFGYEQSVEEIKCQKISLIRLKSIATVTLRKLRKTTGKPKNVIICL